MKQISNVAVIGLITLTGCSSMPPEQLVERTVPDKSVPIYYTAFEPNGPNSVGGAGVYQQFINPSHKVFKYVRTYYTAQDRVLETVKSEVGGKVVAGTKAIGPYSFGAITDYLNFGPLWYNGSIKCVTITRVEITYMDDTSTVIEGPDVAKIVQRGQIRSCMK